MSSSGIIAASTSTTVDDLWKLISSPLIHIFTDSGNDAAKQRLSTILESLIKRSTTLNTVLLPPYANGVEDEAVRRKYAVFATWLSGIMCKIVGEPWSNEILSKTIEIQSCMLRILFRHHAPVFRTISVAYMNIMQELTNSWLTKDDEEEMTFSEFRTEPSATENLELVWFPVVIKCSRIPAVQISILQIIMNTSSSAWDEKLIVPTMQSVITVSMPSVKFLGLTVCKELLEFDLINDKETTVLVLLAMEMTKNFHTWFPEFSEAEVRQCLESFAGFIKSCPVSTRVIELCYQTLGRLLSQLSSFNKTAITLIAEAACQQMELYFHSNLRSATESEMQVLLAYFAYCPDFTRVFARFVVTEVQKVDAKDEETKVWQVSSSWKTLLKEFTEFMRTGKYKLALYTMKVAWILQIWLSDEDLQVKLFDRELDDALELLISKMDENFDYRLVFEYLVGMARLNEAKRSTLLRIVSLPFTEINEPMITNELRNIARNLENESKMECLEVLCECGTGEEVLKVLTKCVSGGDANLIAGAILNSVLILKDGSVTLQEISKHLLQPAFYSKNKQILGALAQCLGRLVCYLSGSGRIVRSPDDLIWRVECDYCDEDSTQERNHPPSLPKEHECTLCPYLSLISSGFASVRLLVSENILRFSNHMQTFNNNGTAKTWLAYIQDDNPQVRKNIACVIGQVFTNKLRTHDNVASCALYELPSAIKEFVDLTVQTLLEAQNDALEGPNHSLHDTLLLTARNCGCVDFWLMERKCASIFLVTILHPASSQVSVALATNAYQELARYLGLTAKGLYVRYKTDFLHLIMEQAVENYLSDSYNIATSLHRVAKCFGYDGSRHLLTKDAQYAVYYLLRFIINEPQSTKLLKDLAELIGLDEKQMLVEYFPYICSQAFLDTSIEINLKCPELVVKITQVTLPDLVRQSFMGIFEELMIYFNDDKCLELLKIISRYDASLRGNMNSQAEVACYLNTRLHGILVNYDIKLGPTSDEFTNQTILASLAELIKFMGATYITPLRYKILATLRTSMSFTRPGFGPLICDAWHGFIHNISPDDLGPLLPTICVSLVPLMKTYPEKTNSMLEYLILDCPMENFTHVAELFFIDELDVPERIKSIVKARILQARPESFKANLQLWLRRITHETDEVRARALSYLKRFLAEHRSQLNAMILSETGIHPLIVEVLDILLMGFKDKEESVRLLYGECLGELGAIEPSLLPRRIISRGDTVFIPDMNTDFACAMLIELARAFQMEKSSKSMDSFALAIQELLKAYGISSNGPSSEVWNNLPLNIQQIITPFVTSHYKIVAISNDNEFSHPIYGSEDGNSVEDWSYNWLCSMFAYIGDDKVRSVLQTCKFALKRDLRILTFCLPYIITFIITGGVEEYQTKIREEMLAVMSRKESLERQTPRRQESKAKAEERCAQIVFSILDHLQRWLWEERLKRDAKYNSVKTFLGKLDNLVLAECCYRSREYHRALMYLEQHMEASNSGLSNPRETDLLATIYAQLDEPDGVSGVLDTQADPPTLQQSVLAHKISGRLQDAVTCYERLAQKQKLKPTCLKDMISCYLSLDHHLTAKSFCDGLVNDTPELEFLVMDDEPFWSLAHLTKLDDTEQRNVKHDLLDDLKRAVKPDLSHLKMNLVSHLEDAARPGAYQQSYNYIMKLHVVNEFDKAVETILSNSKNFSSMLDEWEKRGQLIRAARGGEFVLSMRRATLELAAQLQEEISSDTASTLKREIGKIWLKSAKIARKSGLHQQAYMSILSATDSCPPQQLYIEQAQLYWQKGCQEDAFTTLRRCFAECFKPSSFYKQLPVDQCVEERRQCAKAKLLFAKYNDETLNVDASGNINNYKEAIEVWRGWEKSLLACAEYYESIVNRMPDEDKDLMGRELQMHMLHYYAKSLQYGCKYIHQSMPKMLTIWLDFASRNLNRPVSYSFQDREKLQQSLEKMTQFIEVYQERLPTFMWLTAFSQLVSRICHPSPDVQRVLSKILVKLIHAYPQHCLWMMASVFNSSYPARQRRCQEILNDPRLRTPETSKLIRDFNKLWEKLIELSNKPIPSGTTTTTVNQLCKNLPRLLSHSEFSRIMMPTTKFRQMHLPSKGLALENYNPFSPISVSIVGIRDTVAVMPSLQRPRRITFLGSDGKEYLFMCKPKDDLRKDFRLMEFNDIVNKYLQSVPESRQRRLYIRTYSVVPLNEECGLIEWVPNLVGLRPVIIGLHKERGLTMSNREMKTMLCDLKDPLEKKKKIFLEKLLPRNPSVLGDWFRMTFPDAYGWYEARTAFIRTTAVMSMVGYILGLGDRHGENILIDSKCGDCVHVDFNCLFNRGELLDWPERVPFRLTHNMVDAMGPLKTEGPFRRSCEITMRILRQQSSTLISVLTPFVYDPLVSWNRNQLGGTGEKTNEKAVENIKNIEQRLNGQVRSHGKKLDSIALNLSVEGQTKQLILEATNIDNLCQMYLGWGAYM